MKVKVTSFSELDTARQCEHKHRLAYKERWKSPRTGPALVKGTSWHQVLETHYNVLKGTQPTKGSNILYTPDHRLDLAVEAVKPLIFRPNSSEPLDEVAELVGWMYAGYIEKWGIDPQWKVLAVEYATEVWLPTATGSRSMFKLKLKIDLVVMQDGHLWVVDHKSGKDLPKKKQLDINDQFALYTWALHQLGKDVFGSLHNAARTQRNQGDFPAKVAEREASIAKAKAAGKKPPGELEPQTLEQRFERNRLTRTPHELDTVAVEAYKKLRAVWRIPVGEEPRSPDEDRCGWRCDFLEPCLFGRKGHDERRMLEELGFVQDFTRH